MDRPRRGQSSQQPQQWRHNSTKSQREKRLERFSKPPPATNTVEDFGFVSKGDERLKDHRNQEQYHKHITKKYLSFCATSGGPDSLESDFAALSLTPVSRPASSHHPSQRPEASKNVVYNDARNAELTSILLSMRKLREGITASRRIDAFAVDVFKQHIRAAILVQQIESYHSALLHLLYEFHALNPLNPADLQEFASYLMLHHAARMEDYTAAYAVRNEFAVGERRILQVVSALVHGNWWSWRVARNKVDQYVGRLMDFAEERMRALMLKSIGATYFKVERKWLEIVAGMDWEKLRAQFEVGWELDAATGMVTVRRPKMRGKPG
ncbi:hypothetical protein EX30DRAFT_331006 [Ascodesmis nigricans]|uniref:Uncharacterized protein n=1 Tax=Ascodesmis nigricans TaxID=341454 RepID=A0A4S2MXR6_9PEZI|nr:hypothetical protein EX30DRAFT_331006 [Ascodesmis nigricans]